MPKHAKVIAHFDGDTMTWELRIDDKLVIYCWSTNEAIEKAAALGAIWPDGAPELSHIPRRDFRS